MGLSESVTVTAKFTASDNETTNFNDLSLHSHGATLSKSNGIVTLTKSFNYDANRSNYVTDELKLTVTDAAGNATAKSSSFAIITTQHDLGFEY